MRRFQIAARRTLAMLICLVGGPCLAQTAGAVVSSPDNKIGVEINLDASGHLQYLARLDDRVVLLPSPLGIVVNAKDLGAGALFAGGLKAETHKESRPMFGGHRMAANNCSELIVPLVSGEKKTMWTLEVRAYNDGIAFRYRVPGEGKRRVSGEATTWRIAHGAQAWFQPHNARKDYEAVYQRAAAAELPERLRPRPARTTTATAVVAEAPDPSVATTPLTFKTADGVYLSISEANLIGYSDMAFECLGDDSFKAYFHNTPDGWDWDGEIVSPWRTAIIARDLNTLANSDLIRNLCPPPAPELAGADWIKPGRSTWHWMVTGRPQLAVQPQWIDWTAALGFEYYIIDDGWNRWRSDDGAKDAWACMKDVVDYAKSKNVKIWAWVNSKDIIDHSMRDAYMTKANEAGVVGLKIDFMKPADPEWVQWYDDALRDGAKHRLMMNFHGALKPSGRETTWPHELTREAVKGREGGKQSGLHDTTLPFTRYVQGPADYTPVDFRTDKLRGSSWAHELSMAIVFTSPLLVYGGSPENYIENDAAGMIRAIPATWDETVVLPGSEIGEIAAFARRSGDTWFVGVLNGGGERTFSLDFSFLGNGVRRIESLGDDPENAAAWKRAAGSVSAGDKRDIGLRRDGGYVAKITPQD